MSTMNAPPPDLAELLPSWILSLRAERKSPKTIESYSIGVDLFLRWCAQAGHPPSLDKPTVQRFLIHVLDEQGHEPATALARFRALRRYSAWLHEEEEVDEDALATMKPPKLNEKVRPSLTDDELRALIKSCSGKKFVDRRDEAMVRLMAETGLRAGEALNVDLAGVDLLRGTLIVLGKGRRERVVPFGPQTAKALDRYMRMRRVHPYSSTPALWLGGSSQTFGYSALHKTLTRRSAAAGIVGFHPHRLRRTAATRWLRAGGSEQGLMSVAGWSTRAMIDRYTAHTASDRAVDEARALNLGEL